MLESLFLLQQKFWNTEILVENLIDCAMLVKTNLVWSIDSIKESQDCYRHTNCRSINQSYQWFGEVYKSIDKFSGKETLILIVTTHIKIDTHWITLICELFAVPKNALMMFDLNNTFFYIRHVCVWHRNFYKQNPFIFIRFFPGL